MATILLTVIGTVIGGLILNLIMRFIDMQDKSVVLTPLRKFLGEVVWFAVTGLMLFQTIVVTTSLVENPTQPRAILAGAFLGAFLSILRESILSQSKMASEKMRDDLREEILDNLAINLDKRKNDELGEMTNRLEVEAQFLENEKQEVMNER